MNVQLYREAEARLWMRFGTAPRERRIRLDRYGIRVRIMEAGNGPPVLFIHGGPNAGSTWAELVGLLPDFRCIVLDRPGTGLSDPLPLNVQSLPPFADHLVADVLDALDIDRAHVVVSSFGGYIAIRSAAEHPERVERTVQMGCPGFVPGMLTPPMMKMIAFPGMWRLIPHLPPSEKEMRKSIRNLGHGATLDASDFPQEFYDWYVALHRHTPTMRNELGIIARIASLRGFHPSLTLDEATLSRSTSPTHFIWGEEDPFGGVDVARNLVDALPAATLEMWPNSGHLPWIDDTARAAKVVRDHLLGVQTLQAAAD